jgi:hypothetical protein
VFRSDAIALDWGSKVVTKVLATNVYGDSIVSGTNKTTILMTNPGVPFGLAEYYDFRNATTLGLTW